MMEFREELKAILLEAPELDLVILGKPQSYGWLRRSEFDTPTADAWERPDGVLCSILRCSDGQKQDGRSRRSSND